MPIEGTWIANYASRAHDSSTDIDDEVEKATLVFENGQITGHDPHGGKYDGTYSLNRATLQMAVNITTDDPGAISIFGLQPPLALNLRGHYSRPDFISLRGQVAGKPFDIVLNCRRQGLS